VKQKRKSIPFRLHWSPGYRHLAAAARNLYLEMWLCADENDCLPDHVLTVKAMTGNEARPSRIERAIEDMVAVGLVERRDGVLKLTENTSGPRATVSAKVVRERSVMDREPSQDAPETPDDGTRSYAAVPRSYAGGTSPVHRPYISGTQPYNAGTPESLQNEGLQEPSARARAAMPCHAMTDPKSGVADPEESPARAREDDTAPDPVWDAFVAACDVIRRSGRTVTLDDADRNVLAYVCDGYPETDHTRAIRDWATYQAKPGSNKPRVLLGPVKSYQSSLQRFAHRFIKREDPKPKQSPYRWIPHWHFTPEELAAMDPYAPLEEADNG